MSEIDLGKRLYEVVNEVWKRLEDLTKKKSLEEIERTHKCPRV